MTRTTKSRAGFTLIELLVVLVILGLLAALVAPNVFRHLGAAKETTAKSQIEMLGAALDAYRLDTGRYPTAEQGLAALSQAPITEPRPANWRGPYLRKAVPLDPWGNAYLYHTLTPAAGATTGDVELASLGADAKPGGTGEDADVTLTR